MTYFPDLSPYSYFGTQKDTVNIGWLHVDHPYQKGDTPTDFQERLKKFCKNAGYFNLARGYHDCEFCGQEKGNGEIRIFTESKTYAAPVMVYHYVKEHGYQPPEEFIQAVMQSPLPDSEEYVILSSEMWKEYFSSSFRLPSSFKDTAWPKFLKFFLRKMFKS